MIIATQDTAMGSPCPIWPYALPASDAPIPRIASVVANPSENATESINSCPPPNPPLPPHKSALKEKSEPKNF